MKNILSIIFIPAFLLAGCEKIIEFEGERIEPKLVLYSIISPDSLIEVNLAKSWPVFDEDYTPSQLKDAEVRLFADNTFAGNLMYKNPPSDSGDYHATEFSRYLSEIIAEPGKTYRIEAKSPGLNEVSSETSLPPVIPIIDLDTTYIYPEEPDNSGSSVITPVIRATIRFKDPPETENFYRLNVQSLIGVYSGSKTLSWMPLFPVIVYKVPIISINSDDPVLKSHRGENIFGEETGNVYSIFSDELIAGKEYALTFELPMFYEPPNTNYYEFHFFEIELQSITEDLYLHLRSSSAHRILDDNLFSEPVLIYSNIENGLGVFGAATSSHASIRIGEYPVEGVEYADPEHYSGNEQD